MSSDKEKVKCVFCATAKTEKLLIFSKAIMEKCVKILRLRKLHNLKYNDIILPEEIFDSGYHSSCYKAFTALKKKFFSTDADKKVLLQNTSSSATEQPSTSINSSIIDDTMVQDSLLSDVNDPETNDVTEKNIDAEVDQPFEEKPFEDSTESLTVQNSDTVASANLNLCFFCNKKKNNISVRMSDYVLQEKMNFKKVSYQTLSQILKFTMKL